MSILNMLNCGLSVAGSSMTSPRPNSWNCLPTAGHSYLGLVTHQTPQSEHLLLMGGGCRLAWLTMASIDQLG